MIQKLGEIKAFVLIPAAKVICNFGELTDDPQVYESLHSQLGILNLNCHHLARLAVLRSMHLGQACSPNRLLFKPLEIVLQFPLVVTFISDSNLV